jgi:hypothetical protein
VAAVEQVVIAIEAVSPSSSSASILETMKPNSICSGEILQTRRRLFAPSRNAKGNLVTQARLMPKQCPIALARRKAAGQIYARRRCPALLSNPQAAVYISVGRQIPITQILPEYLTCQAYLSTVSEQLQKTGTYLSGFAQVPE